MKRTISSACVIFGAALVLTGAGRQMGGGRGSSGGTVYRQRRVTVPRASMPQPQHVVRDQSRADYPQKYGNGARISKPAASTPPAHHADVVRNASFARNIPGMERSETRPNHYYWHNDNGMRYSHYFDGRNHWYGFYHGPTFYWTRFFGNRWWWADPVYGRWVFWANGFWWWGGPGGVPYVYIDNGYYPYEDSGVTVELAKTQETPASIPAADGGGGTTNSPDSRRLVQVFGSDAQAFLYDKTVAPPRFVKYLGDGVSKVRFSGGTDGAPVQILVEFKDDTFALFDADGNSQSSVIKKDESATVPPPAAAPPPPTSAPGQ